MTQWNISTLVHALRILFIGSPQTLWSQIFVWHIRIITISLLLRTYIIPWLFALTSKHIRVRSISLRSIKGLYFRSGRWVCRAERIGYVFGKVEGRRRLTVRFDGLKVEMEKEAEGVKPKTRPKHRRNLTLADLHPSPLAGHLWRLVTKVALQLEPWLRPLIRNAVVACLRVGIQWLPARTQTLSFELHLTVFTVAQVLGTQVVADEINVHAEVKLTQVESLLDCTAVETLPTPQAASWTFYGMATWKKKMSDGMRRALDRAWGRTHGTAMISFKLNDVAGTTPTKQGQSGYESNRTFLRLPGTIALDGKLNFYPQTATIDANSVMLALKVDEIAMKVDLLNDILRVIIPQEKATHSATNLSKEPLPMTPSSSKSSGEAEGIITPLPSITKRSRSSTIFSTGFLPISPATFSLEGRLLSPTASASPFLKAFSSSISPRGRIFAQPNRKLKDHEYKSLLSAINNVTIQVSSVSLSFSSSTSTSIFYKTAINGFRADFHPSTSTTDPLHSQWLGRTMKWEGVDAETYGLRLRFTTVVFERHKQNDVFPLVTLGSLDFQAVAFQWPSPWLTPSMFMKNDPNAPFVATSLNIGGVDLTDRLDDLRDLLERRVTKSKAVVTTPKKSLFAKLDSLQLPRCSIQVHCGVVCARMICENSDQQTSSTLEMRTNGFSFGTNASYDLPSDTTFQSLPSNHAHWMGLFSFSLDPVLIHVRSGWASVGFATDNEFLNDPAVLSIGAVEFNGRVDADTEEELGVYRVKGASISCDVHTIVDTFCVELWHAASVSATIQLLAMLPSLQPSDDAQVAPAKQLSLPSGITTSLSLARLIVVVTAPDINPKETDLSRGVGLKALVSLEFCAPNLKEISRPKDTKHLESRMLLGLSKERLADTIMASGGHVQSDVSVIARLSVSNMIVRNAVATQYESDDPFLAGRDDLTPTDQEFIRIENIGVDASLTVPVGEEPPHPTCQVTIDVPSIRGNFQLGSVYSALLALQTLQTLSKVRRPIQPRSQGPPPFKLSMECRIQTFNLLLDLPNQAVVSLLEDACFTWFSGQPVRTQFKSLVFWVPPPTNVNRWEHNIEQKWDELLTLHQWDIALPVEDHSKSIAAKGESLRLRIPHGYVLADLILDLAVVAKAVKHLVEIVGTGTFSGMPAPEAEGPKLCPNITFDIDNFCIEAIDDPLEAKLGAIWKIGLDAAKQRLEREEAFNAKVAAISAAGVNTNAEVVVEGDHDYRFSARSTVSIDDARRRLDEVHFLDWKFRLQNLKTAWSKQETLVLHRLYGPRAMSGKAPFNDSRIAVDTEAPPLFRVFITSLNLSISLPTFPLDKMPDFLYEQGQGLPKDTEFSLLVPLHINLSLNSFRITVRDFPIPLLHVQGDPGSISPAWIFDSDIVIAEEMGSELSTDWVECIILSANQGLHGAHPLFLHVPKTIMPVKSYACPNINVCTRSPTILSWGVSYNPVIQDIVKVIETLSPNPRDPSPPIGFWDKLRLIAHWKIKCSFQGEVRCYLKGSRDPAQISDDGAGFVLVWRGSTQLLIGYPNDQRELIQVTSNVMLIAIPRFGELTSDGILDLTHSSINPYRKICAELHSGVRYGISFVFERTCDDECPKCSGNIFQRQCRNFDFVPHHDVRLETKPDRPIFKGIDDSYRQFRSDFIHFSFSLAASTKTRNGIPNALHLTPKAFAHFWAWFSLFDSIPTLRVRVGSYFPPRMITPKFGRHIATIKYRIILTKLFVMHGYIDDSQETWTDGTTPWIGVKGMIDELRVDMHQRDQETKIRGIDPDTTKTTRHKPFYAAEVVLKGVVLQTVLAIFKESLKTEVSTAGSPHTSAYLKYSDLAQTPLTSSWYNIHDFVELDWASSSEPLLHYLPLATCPRFAYFKRNAAKMGNKRDNKFGIEPTHYCLLGEEPSAPQIQIELAASRIEELKQCSMEDPSYETSQSRNKMMTLLQDYIKFLTDVESDKTSDEPHANNYHLPSEIVLPEEWAEFDHVYQLHCPNLALDRTARDIMIQYYHCSRERKGFEYHLATRAVRFIRDRAKATQTSSNPVHEEQHRNPTNTAQLAASAIRRMLRGEGSKAAIEIDQQEDMGLQTDPLDGWSDGVTLRKAHCCFLLKPQVVLRDEESGDVCVVAAVQAKLQSFAIMDNANIDDPISGKIMTRSYTSLSGFQTFSPVRTTSPDHLRVPLEVLIDLRCENDGFERLVPQTDAIFHYDKFNRLRLRNDVTSEPMARSSLDTIPSVSHTHLQDQTDLIRIHIPQFTVSANDKHFQIISNVVTKLLLFSNATHKARLDKLETLLFTYDFTDLCEAADVVTSLQGRLRAALETERMIEYDPRHLPGEEDTKLGRLQLRAHIITLTEELNYLFDAINLAYNRTDERMDQKSALLVHASSSEMSWRMLNDDKGLLAKLVVQNSNFYWLSRQDSALVNDLSIGNLQAFDGSTEAIWTEILSKHDEPANHPLHKRNLFLLAHWIILPPVGGISIYEAFEVSLHPLKLQIDAKVGRRIMEYLWPDRRHRPQSIDDETASSESHESIHSPDIPSLRSPPIRTSLDSPRALHHLHPDSAAGLAPPGLRKLGPSRSFTDLRSTRNDHRSSHLSSSNSGPSWRSESPDMAGLNSPKGRAESNAVEEQGGDAAVMKTRSFQKTFIFVKIASMNLVLSIVKEGSFECHDVRIKTKDLVYRNQTSSFEALVNQFIPSNMNWKGWMKMVFHQPLIPVFPVAREILSKTKLIGSSKGAHDTQPEGSRGGKAAVIKRTLTFSLGKARSRSLHPSRTKKLAQRPDVPVYATQRLTTEPEALLSDEMGVIQTPHRRDI
ncbi:hypothetical protein P691DRAFT_757138 [Macrolepiota fuliginosa MF-IS2]|uniref:Uncharacterized protein n=1 Tax=Macrolepiota fuliginosa MF-IS2 TaxID=1400762 RepID=A0A9P5XJ60_9AGAR|nr:hypothetical protein P691DRAFT_757138 [Macrolepiota fuliginosa MF-IS2]